MTNRVAAMIMPRTPEPELMLGRAQAEAYARADFTEPNARFVNDFLSLAGANFAGTILDLGCGPGDIALRLAQSLPGCVVHGLDGSGAMLAAGRKLVLHGQPGAERVRLIRGFLPGAELPLRRYDAVISNSLLHHLPEPMVLWRAVCRYARPGAPVLVADLARPRSAAAARLLVETYSGDEPQVLKDDFLRSLLASFRVGEVRRQLVAAGLAPGLRVRMVSDRHWAVAEFLAPPSS